MPRTSLQVLLAITLVMAVFYFWRPTDLRTPDQATAERRGELPKTYLYAIRRWTYDEDGQLAGIMEAIQAEDFPRRRETRFTLPDTWPAKRLWLTSTGASLGKLYINNYPVEIENSVTAAIMTELDISGLVKKLASAPRALVLSTISMGNCTRG